MNDVNEIPPPGCTATTSNTSPLIALAQIGRLDLLTALYGTVVIPPSVKAECVDRGRDVGARDVHEIEGALREGWLKIVDLDRTQRATAAHLMESAKIGQGEAEAITLAKAKGLPVILDDAEARAVARSLGVEHRGTVMVPYEAFARRMIPRHEMIQMLTELSRVLWISPGVVAEILRRAEEASP